MIELLKNSKPELLKEWDYERNTGIDLERVRVNASDSAWWVCSKNREHKWQTRVRNRALDGNGCPFCSGRRVLRDRSFGALYRHLAGELHPEKNPGIDPFVLSPGSNKTAWWICSHGHEWQRDISSRVRDGSGCPKCARIKGRETLADSALRLEFHPTKNSALKPELVTLKSRVRIWWRCPVNPEHEWQESVHYRVKTRNKCPKCHPRARATGQTLEDFSGELCQQWATELNQPLTPRDVTIGSGERVWWRCVRNANHPPWQATVYNRTHFHQGCPQCYERAFDEKKSIARMFPKLAAEWHPTRNGNLTPESVTFGSARKVWWRCSRDPSHEWSAVINVRTKNQRGCPICASRRISTGNSLSALFPKIAEEWHAEKNAPLTASGVTGKSARKVWWRCSANPTHEWPAQIKNRTILGTGCPHCAQENNVFQIIRDLEHSAYNTTKVYQIFLLSVRNVERLAKIAPSRSPLRTTFFRMLYAQVITALEAYLSDSFLRLVVAKPALKRRMLTEVHEFRERKFSFADILELNPAGDEAIAHMLSDISWHNISKARALYSAVLGIEFPTNLAALFKAVTIRHDIVHRNGKSTKGTLTFVSEAELSALVSAVKSFVQALDAKLTVID